MLHKFCVGLPTLVSSTFTFEDLGRRAASALWHAKGRSPLRYHEAIYVSWIGPLTRSLPARLLHRKGLRTSQFTRVLTILYMVYRPIYIFTD
jgi:hypothetical protein